GRSPDLEMEQHLEHAGFARVPPLAGWVGYTPLGHGDAATLAIAQGLVRNQGDAWTWMLEELARFFERATGRGAAPPAEPGHAWLAGRLEVPPPSRDMLGLPL